MNKRDKHKHNPPFSKAKTIDKLLASDFGKVKWHRIFGFCMVLNHYNSDGKTVVSSSFKHIKLHNGMSNKWIDIIGNGVDGKIQTTVSRDELFDSVQDDDIQKNLAPRIKIIS
jgi:hypothetical protein